MESFAVWFGGRRLALLRFATVLCVDQGTAQDVVQEVAYRAHDRWGRIQRLERPEAYLRRMVVNEYLSWRRKWGHVVTSSALVDGRLAAAEDAYGRVDDRDQLRSELAKLPPRQRAVIVLRFYEGLSHAEIAKILTAPPGTVRSLQTRALQRLRIEMSDPEDPIDTRPPPRLVTQPLNPSRES